MVVPQLLQRPAHGRVFTGQEHSIDQRDPLALLEDCAPEGGGDEDQAQELPTTLGSVASRISRILGMTHGDAIAAPCWWSLLLVLPEQKEIRWNEMYAAEGYALGSKATDMSLMRAM